MAENKNTTTIQFKRGTAAELASYVPSSGEPVFATDLKLLKVGDGQQSFEDISSPPSEASVYYVHNNTGNTIYKGQATYTNGVTAGGKIITIDRYIADGTIESIRFLGLAKEDIAHGSDGEIVHFGHVTHVNTTSNGVNINATGSDFQQGDILYASPTVAGTLTTTKPTQGAISVAFVLDAGTNGELFVRPSIEEDDYSVDEVTVSSTPLSNWNVGGSSANFVKVTPTTGTNITGIDKNYKHKRFTILNDSSSYNITLTPQAVGSSAGNKLRFSEGVGSILYPKEKADFIYDNIDEEWLVVKHGISSNTKPITNAYGSAVVSGVYNAVIVSSGTYNHLQQNNITDPNTIYFVP